MPGVWINRDQFAESTYRASTKIALMYEHVVSSVVVMVEFLVITSATGLIFRFITEAKDALPYLHWLEVGGLLLMLLGLLRDLLVEFWNQRVRLDLGAYSSYFFAI